MSHFRGCEEHRSRVGTRGDACAASYAGGRVKRGFGRILGHQDRIGIRGAAGGRGDESPGLNDSIEWRPIDGQIAQDGKCARAPGLKSNGIAVVEEAHRKRADRGAAPAAVGYSIDQKTAGAADSLAAIVLEGNRRFARGLEIFVEQIEHLQKRHLRLYTLL